jgi:hypothetical protein
LRNLSLLLACVVIAAALFAALGVNKAGAAVSPADSTVQILQNEYTTNGLNNSDGGVGSYALYLLLQAGVDVSTWECGGVSLEEAVISAINDDLSDMGASAKLLAQDLLAAKTLGEDGLADDLMDELLERESSSGFDDNPYSDIPAYDLIGRADLLSVVGDVYAKDYILAAQNATASDPNYGSFGSVWGTDFYPDFMTTAQAVRALQYLDPAKNDSEIQNAIDAALAWMEEMQQDDGSFLGSAWDDPVIDTAEVIITLAALGLDPATWESGSGNTADDYMINDAINEDGSFGTSKNVMDVTWALSAYNLMDTMFYLDPATATLKPGDTKQIRAVWDDAAGAADVTVEAQWSAADGSVVSVNSSGLVTALKEGETEIYAVYGGRTASAKVTVSPSSSGGIIDSGKTVYLAVVGKDSEPLYGPSRVSVDESNEWGLTALGALDASGISYVTSSWSYGYLVNSIEGLANSGMSGWMYTVNGSSPGVGSDQYEIENNDKIIFYYSESMDQAPPQWDDLKKLSATGAIARSDDLPDPVSDIDLNAALENAGIVGLVVLQAYDVETSLALSIDQINKILNRGKPLSVTVQGVQFILSTYSLEAAELLTENAAMLQFEVQKLSSEDTQNLAESFAVKLKLGGEIYELNVQVVNENGTLQGIEKFPGCRVLLPVPAGLEQTAAAGLLKAFWYNEGSRIWEEVGGAYNAADGTVGFDVSHFSKYALLETIPAPELKAAFTDIAGHWAQAEIEYMAARGCVSGVGAYVFAPEARITRAEFASILARMAGLANNNGAAECYSDVPAGAWYRGMVGAAAAAGLVSGTSENTFAPDVPVTREQMAAMLIRFMADNGSEIAIGDAGTAELLADFNDAAAISPWACSPVALAVRDRLMVGRGSGMFMPSGEATRAEATVVLCRALQKLPQTGE